MRHRSLLSAVPRRTNAGVRADDARRDRRRRLSGGPRARTSRSHGHMQAITLQVILRTVFGVEGAARASRGSTGCITEILDIAAWPPCSCRSCRRTSGRWSPWGRYLRKRRESDAIIFAEIRERRARGHARPQRHALDAPRRARRGRAPMSDEELHDELMTLLVAGHETTATALAWTFRWLLERPDVAARMRRELAQAEAARRSLPRAHREARAPRRRRARGAPAPARAPSRRAHPPAPMPASAATTSPRASASLLDLPRAAEAGRLPRPASGSTPTASSARSSRRTSSSPSAAASVRCIGMAFALYEMKMVLARVVMRTTLAPRLGGGRCASCARSITMTPSTGCAYASSSEGRARSPRTRPEHHGVDQAGRANAVRLRAAIAPRAALSAENRHGQGLAYPSRGGASP